MGKINNIPKIKEHPLTTIYSVTVSNDDGDIYDIAQSFSSKEKAESFAAAENEKIRIEKEKYENHLVWVDKKHSDFREYLDSIYPVRKQPEFPKLFTVPSFDFSKIPADRHHILQGKIDKENNKNGLLLKDFEEKCNKYTEWLKTRDPRKMDILKKDFEKGWLPHNPEPPIGSCNDREFLIFENELDS